jgi:hypothetical protein
MDIRQNVHTTRLPIRLTVSSNIFQEISLFSVYSTYFCKTMMYAFN